jgi:lipopolysaccharide transport system ATP-binding protein
MKIKCRQEIRMDLGPGEYVFELGLAAISTEKWKNRRHVSHEEMSVRNVRLCHVPNVGHSVALATRMGCSVDSPRIADR